MKFLDALLGRTKPKQANLDFVAIPKNSLPSAKPGRPADTGYVAPVPQPPDGAVARVA
jgi:hypothetical protein